MTSSHEMFVTNIFLPGLSSAFLSFLIFFSPFSRFVAPLLPFLHRCTSFAYQVSTLIALSYSQASPGVQEELLVHTSKHVSFQFLKTFLIRTFRQVLMTAKFKIRAHLQSHQANSDPLLLFYGLYLQISLADVYSVSSL